VYDAIFAERMNTPTVVLVNEDFVTDARSASSGKGMPGIRLVSQTVPCECTITDKIVSIISDPVVIDNIVAGVTKPLILEEESPPAKEVEKPARVVFKGDLQEIDTFFYRRGWTDGLPIMPPTEEAVREMLRGTDLPPDHLVTKMIPRMGKVTVEKIAINAVMAGALPTYMPILIAGVQALMDPKAAFGTWEVSTGSWAPFWIISGPIRHQLHVNSGTGALSPGDRANAAMGRALGLIVKNLGGARKGVEDMGVMGNPGKYSMVAAENEEASPWEPLHVEQGFRNEDNCVTVSFPNSIIQVWPYGSDDKGILRSICSNIAPGRPIGTIMLTPPHAQALADGGWTKKEIAAFVAEYARVPAYRHPDYWGTLGPEKPRPPLNAEDPTPIIRNPDIIRIIVAGGPGAFMAITGGGRQHVTKKVELPGDWETLVKKYKDIVPTYARY
jgi:hypothetical protein